MVMGTIIMMNTLINVNTNIKVGYDKENKIMKSYCIAHAIKITVINDNINILK
jgi:hypothetical protein